MRSPYRRFLKVSLFNAAFKTDVLILFYVCVFCLHLRAWCLQRSAERVRSPGTGVTEGCELPYGAGDRALNCWPLSGPLKIFVFETNEAPMQVQVQTHCLCVTLKIPF